MREGVEVGQEVVKRRRERKDAYVSHAFLRSY